MEWEWEWEWEEKICKGGSNREMFVPGVSYLGIQFSHDKCPETTTLLKPKYLFKHICEKNAKW